MTPSQKKAVEYFRRHLENDLNDNPKYGDQITKFEVEETDYGCLWISAETEMTGLSENNLLRFLDHDWWFVQVGKRGALYAHTYPKSYEQFKGGQAFGINFK